MLYPLVTERGATFRQTGKLPTFVSIWLIR